MLRQLKAIDSPILREDEKLKSSKRLAAMRLQTNGKPDTSPLPGHMDITLLMLYGQILYSGTSYTSALSKLTSSSMHRM